MVELIQQKQNLANFYKKAIIVAQKTRNNRENPIIGLMDYYNEIIDGNRLISIIREEITKHNPEIVFKRLPINFTGEFNYIKNSLSNFSFKGIDEDIFVELVDQFRGTSGLIFISDDRPFVKEANRALNWLKRYHDVNNIEVKKLEDFLSEQNKKKT